MNTPFQLLQDDWIQIASIGEFPHQMGLQRLDAEAITSMTNRFNGFFSKLGRMFAGVPVYQGHHDTDPATYPDGKSYGWIMALDNRGKDGLWGQVKWTEDGRALVAGGAFKFVSPVWNAKEVTRINGRPVYRPETLISLALTNNPNLPLPPLANESNNMNTLSEILQVQPDASAEQIIEAARNLRSQTETLTNTATSEKTRADAANADRIELALAAAISNSRITIAERADWKEKLEKDFPGNYALLTHKKTDLNTQSQTKDLGNEKKVFDNEATRRAELTGYLAEKQAAGMSYDQAWALAKKERAGLFEQMGKKG